MYLLGILISILSEINFQAFKDFALKGTDICLLSETKIDYSFPNFQFFTEGYKMFCKDRNKSGGGLILNIKEGIPSKLINSYDFKEGSKL